MILRKIKNFLIRNKKIIFVSIFFILISQIDLTFAKEGASNASSAQNANGGNGGQDSLIQALNMLLKISGTVLALLTELIGWFMSPGWTTGKAIGFGNHLKELWIMVSNVVYLIFAIVLVWIALMNILGKTGEWELKQAIPRFIGGILIVPMSWFIVSAIIGFSSIMTASVISLPMDSFSGLYSSGLGDVPVYKHYIFNIGKSKGKKDEPIEAKEKTTLSELVMGGDNYFNIMAVYTYGVMRLDANGKLNIGDIQKGNIKTLANLSVKALFDIVFIIIYLILMVAILIALFVRGIYIWIFMVLSPTFGLMYFFKDKGPTAGLSKKFSFKQFISLAMMPVYVAGALSFGLLFILVAGKGMNDSCSGDNTVCIEQSGDSSKIKYLGVTLEFNGTFSGSGEAKKILGGFKGAFGLLVLQVFGLAILWIGVIAAIKTSELTGEAIQPIEKFGDSVGGLLKKAPTYMPILPGPNGPISAAELGSAADTFAGGIDSHIRGKGSNLGTNMLNSFTGEGGNVGTKLDTLNKNINKGALTTAGAIEKEIGKLKDTIENGNNGNGALLTNSNIRNNLPQPLIKIFGEKNLKNAGIIDNSGKLKITDPTKFGAAIKRMNIASNSGAATGAQDFINRIRSKEDNEVAEMFGFKVNNNSGNSENN